MTRQGDTLLVARFRGVRTVEIEGRRVTFATDAEMAAAITDLNDQVYYEPLIARVSQRLNSNSDATRARIGAPQRAAYGPTEIEKLDIYRTSRPNAPVFVFIHGGNWRLGSAKQYGYAAEMFINAGAHYVALDFIAAKEAGGDLGTMAAQVRRGIAWVYQNATSFGGDPERIFIGGHSSGGHLCGVALVTDWQKDFGLLQNTVKGGLCMSGLYEMTPVRLSGRRTYVNFTDAMADAMSAERHIEKLHAEPRKSLLECCEAGLEYGIVRRGRREHADAPHAFGLLRARRDRPRGRPAEKRG